MAITTIRSIIEVDAMPVSEGIGACHDSALYGSHQVTRKNLHATNAGFRLDTVLSWWYSMSMVISEIATHAISAQFV
jgi:hypothetical protein